MSEDGEDFEEEFGPESLAEFIGAFMSTAAQSEFIYRKNYCNTVINRIYSEWGSEGFCELMVAMDKKAEWISDILFESSDFADIAFQKYGVYDPEIAKKARETSSMMELHKKIWRLRRKYAKLIVDEIVANESGASPAA